MDQSRPIDLRLRVCLAVVAKRTVDDPGCGRKWMRLGFVCVENVHNLDAVGFQVIRNERAMTAPPNRFCAHDREWARLHE
jgi:hypothetical protein